MTNAKQQQTVPLEELVGRIGSYEGVKAVMDREGVETTNDWAGRQAVSLEHAALVINSHETAMRSHAEKLARYDAFVRDREAQRHEVGERAFEEAAHRIREQEIRSMRAGEGYAYLGGIESLTISPPGRRAAQEAMAEALERFDRKNPPRRFEDFE